MLQLSALLIRLLVLEDRTRTTTNALYTRKWNVVDIILKTKLQLSLPVWAMFWKGAPEFSEAMVILKGETEGKDDIQKPSLFEDPFKKPRYRKSFIRPRYIERERDGPRVVGIEPRLPHQRRRSMDGGRRVTEVIEPPTLDEAEAKIVGILTATKAE
jgi:hypothetical protein